MYILMCIYIYYIVFIYIYIHSGRFTETWYIFNNACYGSFMESFNVMKVLMVVLTANNVDRLFSCICFGGSKHLPGTPNNKFLMAVWLNNHFPCKDFESSNWNNHKELVVWSSRYSPGIWMSRVGTPFYDWSGSGSVQNIKVAHAAVMQRLGWNEQFDKGREEVLFVPTR